MGFVERIQREADVEATAVVAELLELIPSELRDRAGAVASVLDALSLPVPQELLFLVPREGPLPVRPAEVAPVPDEVIAERAMREGAAREEQAARVAEIAAREAAAERVATEVEEDRTVKRRILGMVEPGTPIKAPEIAQALDVAPPRVKRLLEELVHHDRLVKAGEGVAATYELPGAAPTPKPAPPVTEPKPPKGAPAPPTSGPGGRYEVHHGRIGGRATAQRAAAKDKTSRGILNYVGDHPGADLMSIVKGVDLNQSGVSKYLRMLGDEGKVVRTGTPGAKGSGYKLAEGVEPPDGPLLTGDEEAAAAEPEPAEKPAPTRQEALNAVRGAMQKLSGTDFVADDVHRMVTESQPDFEIPVSMVMTILDLLVEQGALQRTDGGYHYDRPDDPGAAARIDQKRRGARAERGTSLPVAHTGRGPRSGNPDVQALLNAVTRIVGPENVSQSGGHWAIKCPNGQRVLISSTPSSPRSVATDKARLRRLGELAI